MSPATWATGLGQRFRARGFSCNVRHSELFVAADRLDGSIQFVREESGSLARDHEYDAFGNAACLLKVVVGQEDFAAHARGVGSNWFEVRKARIILLGLAKGGQDPDFVVSAFAEQVAAILVAARIRSNVVQHLGCKFDFDGALGRSPPAIKDCTHLTCISSSAPK